MRIGFIGKFKNLWDEEYIARSFEMLGHDVVRIEQEQDKMWIHRKAVLSNLDVLLFTKWNEYAVLMDIKKKCPNLKTVCWVFDLYFDYDRERLVKRAGYFKADYVFTTDGGHDERWKEFGINHKCVRQGIYAPECYMLPSEPEYDVIFIGSENPYYPERTEMMEKLAKRYNFKWFGRKDTNHVRGEELNKLFAKAKVVVGDSVYSPNYWSNRVVETLGRGGFLIHREVPGLSEEYSGLRIYGGNFEDLCNRIDWELSHDEEREEARKYNFEWVRDNYTMEKQCQKLLNYISLD